MPEKAIIEFKQRIYATSRIAVILGEVALAALVIIPVLDIIMRRLINTPLPGAYELSKLILSLMVFSGMAYCGVRGLHISVDILTSHISKRVQKYSDIIIYFFCWLTTGLISAQLFIQTIITKRGHEVSTTLGLPIYPFMLVAGIGGALLTFVFLTQSLEKIMNVVKKSD